MDPVGDPHLSKKKANNPMFNHTQNPNPPPPRKQYYDGNSQGPPNKYTMTNPNGLHDYNSGEINQNYPFYGNNMSGNSSINQTSYKSSSNILGKIKSRHTGSPPAQIQQTSIFSKKPSNLQKQSNSSSNLTTSNTFYNLNMNSSNNSLQNQHTYASSPNLTTIGISNPNSQSSSKSHEYGLFSSKKKKERPKIPQEQATESSENIVVDFKDILSDPNHVPLECVSLQGSSQNLTSGDILNPNINQTVLTSSWAPPDSWDVIDDDNAPPVNDSFQDNNKGFNNQANFNHNNTNQELNLVHSGSVKETESFQTPEDKYYDNNSTKLDEDQNNNYIRVFKTDLTFTTVMCNINARADYVCKKVAAKFFISDYNKYNLVVIRNKLERIIKPSEKPLKMQERWLERLGYTSLDKLNLQGREDNSYSYRFIFKEIQIGREISPKYL